jgi:hypothetical protein
MFITDPGSVDPVSRIPALDFFSQPGSQIQGVKKAPDHTNRIRNTGLKSLKNIPLHAVPHSVPVYKRDVP